MGRRGQRPSRVRGGARIAALLALATVAGACGNTEKMLGMGKRSPDEFAVYSRAPLSLPPDYGLRPPEPGTNQPEGLAPRDQARITMTGAQRPVGGVAARGPLPLDMSGGTQALLARTGGLDAEPGIRALVNEETAILAEEDQSFVDRLVFWGTPTEYGTIVEPLGETQRIQENKALGRSIVAGNTPTIERKRKALFEGIFR